MPAAAARHQTILRGRRKAPIRRGMVRPAVDFACLPREVDLYVGLWPESGHRRGAAIGPRLTTERNRHRGSLCRGLSGTVLRFGVWNLPRHGSGRMTDSDRTIGPSRRRMIEDMTARGSTSNT